MGVAFVAQFPIGGFTVADLRLLDSRVLIYADGCYWHRCPIHFPNNGKGKKDRFLDKRLEELGWIVFRLWERQIKSDVQACINQVLRELEESRKVMI